MPYMIRGIVTEDAAPIAAAVRLYLRSTGELVAEEISSTSGEFEFVGLVAFAGLPEFYVVALDPDGGASYNALIFDRVEPELVLAGSYATWDELDKTANFSLSSLDQVATATGATYEAVRSTYKLFHSATGGKYYWQVSIDTLDNAADAFVGVRRVSDVMTSGVFFDATGNAFAAMRSNGSYFVRGGWSVGGGATSFGAGDVVSFALDIDNGNLFIAVNGTWVNSGDPVAGTGAAITAMPSGEAYAPFLATDNSAGEVTATLIADESVLTASCPAGYIAGLPQ